MALPGELILVFDRNAGVHRATLASLDRVLPLVRQAGRSADERSRLEEGTLVDARRRP